MNDDCQNSLEPSEDKIEFVADNLSNAVYMLESHVDEKNSFINKALLEFSSKDMDDSQCDVVKHEYFSKTNNSMSMNTMSNLEENQKVQNIFVAVKVSENNQNNDGCNFQNENPLNIKGETAESLSCLNSRNDLNECFSQEKSSRNEQGSVLQLVSMNNTDLIASTGSLIQELHNRGCQAVQLPDGTMALIQNNSKFANGLQAVKLEDGSTAYVTNVTLPNLFQASPSLQSISIPIENSVVKNTHAESIGGTTSNLKIENSSASLEALISCSRTSCSERAAALGDKAYKCNYEGCGRLYTTVHHLKVHERAHTGDRPFKCDFGDCDKAFATGYGLKSHMRVHTGEKPYKCPAENCEKGFKTSGDLQKHLRTHTGERPFKCPFHGCNRCFTTSNIRKVHIRTHTGERPYKCDVEGCLKTFASATNYKNHIRIHTGEKPYVCTVQGCGKRFTEYSSLYKHHVVHTHSKPYICNHCGKNYRQTSTLAMHKRAAHGEEVMLDEQALLMTSDDDVASIKPSGVQFQLQTVSMDRNGSEHDDTENNLVINTSEVMLTSDGIPLRMNGVVTTDEKTMTALQMNPENATASLNAFVSNSGLRLTSQPNGEQILVVTDPAQLQVLQQLAAQQNYEGIQAVQVDAETIHLEGLHHDSSSDVVQGAMDAQDITISCHLTKL